MGNNEKWQPNIIIEAAMSKGEQRVHRLEGYLGKRANGKVELYLNLNMNICLELDEEDLIYIVEPEKSTEPAIVFIRYQSRIIIRQQIAASSLVALISGDFRTLQGSGSGGGPQGETCDQRRDRMKKDCETKHPNDPLLQQACKDSADASYNLWKITTPGGGGPIIIT